MQCHGPGRAWVVLALLGAAACVPTSPRERKDLHDALVERTGRGIGEGPRGAAELPEGVRLEDGLSEEEAVGLALWNNPDLQVTLTDLGFAKGDLYEAGRIPNPLFSTFLPLGPKQLEMTLFQSIAALWQRPYRVAAARRDVERTAERLVASGLDTARDTRVGFTQLYVAQARLGLLEHAATTWRRMEQLAKVRLEAGAASQLEVTAVATDARAAELEAVRQGRAVQAERANLAALVNLPKDAQANLRADGLKASPLPEAPPALEGLLERALAGRPEVRAAEIGMEAAGERAGVAKAEIFDLIVVLDSNAQGREGFEAGPGLQVPLPIFYQNQGGRQRAEAEIERAAWQYLAAKNRVQQEVEGAHARLHRALGALAAWPEQVVIPLEKNVGRAEKAYAAGGATYLEVLDATRRLIDAQLRGLELEREARLAWADLLRSVGGNLK